MSARKKVVSTKQVEANRRNALKSTGPRTAEGKANSSQNAITHGISAAAVVVDSIEDRGKWESLLAGFYDEFQPECVSRQLQVERVAWCYWRLARIQRFEQGAIKKQVEAGGPQHHFEKAVHAILNGEISQMPDTPVFREDFEEADAGLEFEKRTLELVEAQSSLLESGLGWTLDSAWILFAESAGRGRCCNRGSSSGVPFGPEYRCRGGRDASPSRATPSR